MTNAELATLDLAYRNMIHAVSKFRFLATKAEAEIASHYQTTEGDELPQNLEDAQINYLSEDLLDAVDVLSLTSGL